MAGDTEGPHKTAERGLEAWVGVWRDDARIATGLLLMLNDGADFVSCWVGMLSLSDVDFRPPCHRDLRINYEYIDPAVKHLNSEQKLSSNTWVVYHLTGSPVSDATTHIVKDRQ